MDWFSSRGKIHCAAREALEIDYLQSGLLTSLEIVEFVTELEDHFGMQFSEEEMHDSRFSTIGGIADLIVADLDQPGLAEAALNRAGIDKGRVDQSSKSRSSLG